MGLWDSTTRLDLGGRRKTHNLRKKVFLLAGTGALPCIFKLLFGKCLDKKNTQHFAIIKNFVEKYC